MLEAIMGKHRHIYLDAEERILLVQLTRKGESSARVQMRARILLLCDRSHGDKRTLVTVADGAVCSVGTVRNVKHNYFAGGVEAALYERPRPGAAPKFTGEDEAHLTLLACSQPPTGHAQWTLRLLADQMVELGYVDEISHVTVGKILKKTNCSLGE
jgi:hypothetical protein